MSHTHGPGETHSHSHSHSPPQTPASPPPDPALQALIDAEFNAISLAVSQDGHAAHCAEHSLEKCPECDVDFVLLNRLAKIFVQNPNLLCPPPANMISKNLSTAITNMKDEGNNLLKQGKHAQAIAKYNMAASIAIQRPPWEASQFMREELSIVVSNRSAAYLDTHDYLSALVDAELVIQIRKNWPKGHFRKAKVLRAMGKLDEAAEALRLGLAFDPTNTELSGLLTDIENHAKKELLRVQEEAMPPLELSGTP